MVNSSVLYPCKAPLKKGEHYEQCVTEYYRTECLMALYKNSKTRRNRGVKRCRVTFAEQDTIIGEADALVDRRSVSPSTVTRKEMHKIMSERVLPTQNSSTLSCNVTTTTNKRTRC